jgi:hypothetical protein
MGWACDAGSMQNKIYLTDVRQGLYAVMFKERNMINSRYLCALRTGRNEIVHDRKPNRSVLEQPRIQMLENGRKVTTQETPASS